MLQRLSAGTVPKGSGKSRPAGSLRLLQVLLEEISRKGLPAGVLLANTRLRPDGSTPMSWRESSRLMSNAAHIFAEGELLDLGAKLFCPSRWLLLPWLSRPLLGPTELYWLFHRAQQQPAQRLLDCRWRFWESAPRRLAFELCLEDDCEHCPELYPLLRGLFSYLPTLLGSAPARVELELAERSALFHIELPRRQSWISSVRWLRRRLRTLRVAVDELQAAHHMLNIQYQELRSAQTSLRESEARSRALIENSSDFILLANAAGRVTYLSPSAERITGYPPMDLLGREHLELAHGDDRQAVREAQERLAATPELRETLRFRFKARAGNWIWLEGTAKNMLYDACLSAILVNYRDVTERIRLEEQLLQSRKLESIGQLAGGIAHDFNNLLTGMLSNAELALLKLPAEHPARTNVEQVAEHANRGADLTAQLLAFARKRSVKPQFVNLNCLVTQTRSLLDRVLGEHIEIQTSLEPDLGSVEIDPGQLQQVLINLAANARDAMPGGGMLTLMTSNRRLSAADGQRREYVVMTVTDTGAGMDSATQARVFEPFFTTKQAGRGTGLGLATCHGIIAQAGGHIDLISKPGAGTRFCVFLPRVDRVAVMPAPLAVPSTPPRGSETVLLVDDELAIRQSIAELLESLGYQVLTARNGLDALETAAQYPAEIHALVTDVVMPKLSGLELGERLLALRPAIKIVYTSGYVHDRVPAGTARGMPLVEKPFDLAALASKLDELLHAKP